MKGGKGLEHAPADREIRRRHEQYERGSDKKDVSLQDRAGKERRYLLVADEDLMSLTSGGDAEAFTALYDRHMRAAFSLAYRMMGERQATEDLVQEAFLKVWRAAGSYRADRGSVRIWILSIVHNRGIDQIRSHASRRRTQERIEASAPRSQPSEAFAETWRNSQRAQVKEALRESAAGAAQGTRARVLLGIHPRGDSGAARPAARDRQGPHEAWTKEDSGVLQLPRDSDTKRWESLEHAAVSREIRQSSGG